ncbi:hypothetical protein AA106555_0715 [Neokomagataea thailandica NBRC 106555]|uniref:Uncharacterized protein n=1 Tax=Neokomagataea thailandica NBRC 106555 TaxID=1223520 RepID=A0ABQ0QNY9_9PROT|nr:hypothetical protein [Neokomagataea thailandica]GBR51870.1 hypothetical protein AA106555_0715 [Neokomagataea thailandica NBRC 106555]
MSSPQKLTLKHKQNPPHPKGLTLRDMVENRSLWDREPPDILALKRLLKEKGWLENSTFNGEQKRWLVSIKAVEDGYGKNILPPLYSKYKIKNKKYNYKKYSPFPVFFKEKLNLVINSLSWESIFNEISKLNKKEALNHIMINYGYLPNKTISSLSKSSLSSVERLRKKMKHENVTF